MPTKDERRQVAARLREKHGERQGTFEPQSMSIQAMNRMDDLLDCLPKRRDMFLDLADLIEPLPERTCKPIDPFDKETKHIVERGLIHYYWPYKGCPECQRDFPQGSNFCPNCGARVKEE